MEKTLLHLHSGWRWIVLVLLAYAIINAYYKMSGGKSYTGKDKKINLFAMIALHIQLLFGIVLYIMRSSKYFSNFSANMSNSIIRFNMIEHELAMIVAIVVITVGRKKAEKASKSKHKKIFTAYTIGLLIILVGIWKYLAQGRWF